MTLEVRCQVRREWHALFLLPSLSCVGANTQGADVCRQVAGRREGVRHRGWGSRPKLLPASERAAHKVTTGPSLRHTQNCTRTQSPGHARVMDTRVCTLKSNANSIVDPEEHCEMAARSRTGGGTGGGGGGGGGCIAYPL